MSAYRNRPILAVLALMLSATAASAAQFVVVEARGVGLKPGTTIDSGKPLVLQQGQHVTLISDSGVTLKIDGPYNKAPSADAGKGVDVGATIAALGTEQKSRLGEVGVTRTGATVVKLPDPWLVDATHPGKACVVEGQQPMFWRAQPTAAATLSIQPSDRSWKADAQWPAGESRLSVSHPVDIRGNATYFVSFNGTESAITMSTVPAVLANDKMRAAWMADRGCEAQAEALLRQQ